MSYQYSWERETIWDSDEVIEEPTAEEIATYEYEVIELQDEEPFLSLEENPEMEDWLMSNV